MATMTRRSGNKSGGSGKGSRRRGVGRVEYGRRNEVPDIRLRPYQHWWVQALLKIWRCRVELLTAVGLIVAWLWLKGHLGDSGEIWAAVVVMGTIAILFAVPHSRRFIWPRAICVVTRHRIRTCMAQLAASNRDGRLPWIVWIRPTPVGERAWLWMLAGLSVKNIENHAEELAVACWAREARIERSRRRAMIVRLDIVRRDPLSAPTPIDNPLVDGTEHVQAVDTAEVIDLITARSTTGPATRPVGRPDRSVGVPTRPTSRVSTEGTKSTSTNANGSSDGSGSDDPVAPRIVTRHGEDVSDYV